MSNTRLEREHLALLVRQLADAGITRYRVERTACHPVLVFAHKGLEKHMVFSGTGDPHARQRNRSNLRKLLKAEPLWETTS